MVAIVAVFALIELAVSAGIGPTVGTAVIDDVIAIIAAFKMTDNVITTAIAVGGTGVTEFKVAIIAIFVAVIADL